MSQQYDPFEPDHLADTGPSRAIRETQVSGWRRGLGLISLIGAAALTLATALLLLTSNPSPAPNPGVPLPATATSVPQVNTPQPQTSPIAPINGLPGTLSPQVIGALLSTPIATVNPQSGLEVVRNDYNPFTIIPDRPRSEVIQYQVQSGDTIFSIAQRYGLQPESIAWANDRNIVEGLRPGQTLNILPVDGVYYTVTASQSIASIAAQYHADPYTIIDSDYNDFFGDTPDTMLPSNTKVVIPGGTDESINWNPPVQRIAGTTGSGGGSSGDKISFDIGDPGSCGLVNNPGGSGQWRQPLAAYTWVRGFSSIHSGVDLADPIGTSIMAATSGTVVFAGWSNWGYGTSVVVASGPYTEIYGHMSAISTRCGASVNGGTIIGAVGDTGNATGPHLHFEIRYNDVPIDPTTIMPFG